MNSGLQDYNHTKWVKCIRIWNFTYRISLFSVNDVGYMWIKFFFFNSAQLWIKFGIFNKISYLKKWNFIAPSCPILCDPHGRYPFRLLCPWDSPGKNTGVGNHSLLQGILPTQRSNPGSLACFSPRGHKESDTTQRVNNSSPIWRGRYGGTDKSSEEKSPDSSLLFSFLLVLLMESKS